MALKPRRILPNASSYLLTQGCPSRHWPTGVHINYAEALQSLQHQDPRLRTSLHSMPQMQVYKPHRQAWLADGARAAISCGATHSKRSGIGINVSCCNLEVEVSAQPKHPVDTQDQKGWNPKPNTTAHAAQPLKWQKTRSS